MHLGRERVICCWQLGDVLVDPGSGSCLPTLLEALGDERPRALLLAHVHLAHDGASGSLVRRWPEIEVHEHERAARHLVDPSRLLEIARWLCGEDMDRRWGEFLPVPESQLRVLHGGERLSCMAVSVCSERADSKSLTRLATPPATCPTCTTTPHSSGDVAGVRITPGGPTMPPTPPPEVDVEA